MVGILIDNGDTVTTAGRDTTVIIILNRRIVIFVVGIIINGVFGIVIVIAVFVFVIVIVISGKSHTGLRPSFSMIIIVVDDKANGHIVREFR